MEEMSFACTKCRKKEPLGELKNFRDHLVCKSCFEEFEARHKVKEGTASREEVRKVLYPRAEKTAEYFCGVCRYTFRRPEDFVVKNCPYCSSPNSVKKSTDFMKSVLAEAAIERS